MRFHIHSHLPRIVRGELACSGDGMVIKKIQNERLAISQILEKVSFPHGLYKLLNYLLKLSLIQSDYLRSKSTVLLE